MGLMNSLQVDLQEIHSNSSDINYGFTAAFSMTQALWAFGGAVGSILGGSLGSRFGRKNTLISNNIFIVTGIILQVSILIC